MQLAITETVAKPVSLLFTTLTAFVLKRVIKKDTDWYPEMKVAEEVVWIIYYQTINLFTIIYCPYFIIVQPIFIYIIFNTYYVFL